MKLHGPMAFGVKTPQIQRHEAGKSLMLVRRRSRPRAHFCKNHLGLGAGARRSVAVWNPMVGKARTVLVEEGKPLLHRVKEMIEFRDRDVAGGFESRDPLIKCLRLIYAESSVWPEAWI